MKLDNDFRDVLHESRSERFFEKIKPFINVTVVVAAHIGLVYGGVLLFGDDSNPKDDSITTANSIANEDNNKLSDCLVTVSENHPVPGSSDTSFYPKLIAGYDAQLDCYDKYPSADNVVSRSSIEYARENALDSSGDYKNTYTSSNGTSSGTHTNATTGCDYSLSESEYLKCSDKYYASNGPSNTSSDTPRSTPSDGSASNDAPSSTGGSSGGSTSTPPEDPRAAGLAKCLEDAKAKSYTSEAARARAINYCYSAYTQ